MASKDLIELIKQNFNYTKDVVKCEKCINCKSPDLGEHYCTAMITGSEIKVSPDGRCDLFEKSKSK